MIHTPPFLLFFGLLFWGWWTGLLTSAVIIGVILESSRHVSFRWEFSAKELRRIWDLCVLLVLGAFVYALFSDRQANPFFSIVQWIPLLFAPIMLAQAYGHQERLSASVFSVLLRAGRRPESDDPSLNISHTYLGTCLLAAGAVNERSEWFFLGLCGLVTWSLWRVRSSRFRTSTWMTLLALAIGLSYGFGLGLTRVQAALDGRFTEWMSQWIGQDFDPGETRTSIGQIGRLKQSGRIVLRVEAESDAPALLRTTSYDNFKNVTWFATRKEFVDLNSGADDGYWKLIANKSPRQTVTIATYLRGGNGIVALPLGTAELDQLPALRLQTNALGVVRTVEAPGLVRYSARYGPGLSTDCPPDVALDREVPENEREALDRIVAELGLENLPATEAARRLNGYFENSFSYTLTTARPSLPKANEDPSALGRFLLQTKAGHCEYFATATVLLLRRAGIPARYAAGYSVQESAGKGRFVVRERHAHAWAIYFDAESDGWRDLDTTPPGWGPTEAATARSWEVIRDLFSRIWFEFSKWRWLADRSALQNYLLWLILPLTAILAHRLLTAKRRTRAGFEKSGGLTNTLRPGLDSEFYRIEERLETLGLGRLKTETAADWVARVKSNPLCPASTNDLGPIVVLHQRHRFDPAGLPHEARVELREKALGWLGQG